MFASFLRDGVNWLMERRGELAYDFPDAVARLRASNDNDLTDLAAV